jgi:arginine N-succinyltransferase
MLVAEDTATGEIVGTASVIACLGEEEPFYSYKLNKVTHVCRPLGKKITVEQLHLSAHFEGFAEVATLYLLPEYRRDGIGKLLARSRYLLMAQFRDRFPSEVMADLRGYFDDEGRSPFWEAVGRHFFEMDFVEADEYGAIHGNQFIADLMPTQPVYVNLLPQEAQDVIGRVNPMGEPALELLKREGFEWRGHIDVFDASPSVDVPIDELKTIKNSLRAQVVGEMPADDSASSGLVASGNLAEFRVCATPMKVTQSGVELPAESLRALNVSAGSDVIFVRSDR